jgi:hypothetical protein
LVNSDSDLLDVRIAINTPADEWSVYEAMLASFASDHGLVLSTERHTPPPVDGCPDFALKTTPDHAVALACDLASRYQLKCVVLCYNGVVHGYLPPTENAAQQVQNIVNQVASSLHGQGGDWRSRHLPRPAAQGVEASWLDILSKEFVTT